MDNKLHDEDIFYSDDDLSDSDDNYQVPEYLSNKNYDIFGRVRQNSSGALSPETLRESHNFATIDRPITQISMGMESMGFGGSFLEQPKPRSQSIAPKIVSYSSIAKKEPLQPVVANTEKPRAPPTTLYKAEPKKPPAPCVRVAETALMAGYRFKARNPEHDPRYPQDQQLCVGPIPGHLEHDVIYNSLRSIFQARGPVCFMFLHKSAVRDSDSGKLVKFGYVVFAEKGVAQKVLKQETITFNGGVKIRVQPMM